MRILISSNSTSFSIRKSQTFTCTNFVTPVSLFPPSLKTCILIISIPPRYAYHKFNDCDNKRKIQSMQIHEDEILQSDHLSFAFPDADNLEHEGDSPRTGGVENENLEVVFHAPQKHGRVDNNGGGQSGAPKISYCR